ncbi:TetR/AcrR family transcriptional regulator [Actinomadura logoneensis]|nr:TetR/AcrR family transcriptional regulator [Actinomadura logoneensis]
MMHETQQRPAETGGRAARAHAVRNSVVESATELFATAGYRSTDLATIAARAGVGEQDVRSVFGSKNAVLAAALERAVAGDDLPVPTLEREWALEALADPDPRGQLHRQVAGVGDMYLRAAPLLDVVRGAAPTDPELAELWETNVRQRLTVQLAFACALAGKTPLREELTPETAADVALAILSPETYHLLVAERKWTHEAWRAWATADLTHMLTTL